MQRLYPKDTHRPSFQISIIFIVARSAKSNIVRILVTQNARERTAPFRSTTFFGRNSNSRWFCACDKRLTSGIKWSFTFLNKKTRNLINTALLLIGDNFFALTWGYDTNYLGIVAFCIFFPNRIDSLLSIRNTNSSIHVSHPSDSDSNNE